MKNKKLLTDSVLYTIGGIIPQLLNFVLLPIYTRFLTPQDYGILNYTNSIIMFLFVLSFLSLNTFLLRHYFDFEKEEERKKLIGNIFLFLLIYNVILFGIEILIFPKIISILDIKIEFNPYFILALSNNFLNIFSIVPLIIFRVKEKAFKFVILNSTKPIFKNLLSLILITKFNYGVLGKYYGNLAVNIIFIVIYFIIVFRNSIFNINIKQIQKGLNFSLPLLPSAISFILIDMIDRIILERYVSLDRIGIYSIAYTLGFGLNVIIQGAYHAFEPVFFKKIYDDDFNSLFKIIKKHYVFIILILGLSIALFSKEILLIMASEQFIAGYLIVPIVLLAAIFKGEYLIFSTVLIGHKKTFIITLATVAGAIINICVNILLIPLLGIYAAAISTVVSFFIMFIFVYLNSVKISSLSENIVKDLLSIIIGGTIVYFVVTNFSFENISFEIILLKIGVVLLYTIFIYKVFDISFEIRNRTSRFFN